MDQKHRRASVLVLVALVCVVGGAKFLRVSQSHDQEPVQTIDSFDISHAPSSSNAGAGSELPSSLRTPASAHGDNQAEALLSPEPSDAQAQARVKYYAENIAKSISVLAEHKCSFILERLPPDFCQVYPAECSQLAANPERPLKDVLELPGVEALQELLASKDATEAINRNRQLTELFEQVRGYSTVELMANRGQLEHTSIERHIATYRPLIDAFSRSAEFLAALGEYGRAVIEEESKVGASSSASMELKLLALLWEERCRKDNQMIATLPKGVGFWLHATRMMTRYVYDDSFWLAPDELSAAEEHYPDYLRER